MNFDWSEYLKLAQELIGQSSSPTDNEAKLRSSISRAYYAVFCKSRNYLIDIGFPFKNTKGIDENIHQLVIDKFKYYNNKKFKKIGLNLSRMRLDRNKADYEDNLSSGLPSMAILNISLAQDIISILDSLPRPSVSLRINDSHTH